MFVIPNLTMSFDPRIQTVIQTDASKFAMRAVLTLILVENECLAIVLTVELFQLMLMGRVLILRKDKVTLGTS